MFAYLARCLVAAKGKVTTYVAGSTALIAAIPDFVQTQWAQLEQEVPWLTAYHHKVVLVGIMATIWTRIRREVGGT